MVDTIYNVLFSHMSYGSLYDVFITTLKDTSDHLCSQTSELLFQLAKGKFYRIEVGGIRNVVYPTKLQLLHQFLTLVRLVHAEVVHENTYFGITVLISELCQVFFKLRDIHWLREQHEEFLSFLARYAWKHRNSWLVYPALVNRHIPILQAVLCAWHCTPRENCLIDVYDFVAVFLRLLQSSNHFFLLSPVVFVILFPCSLFPLDTSSLYLVHTINITKKCVVHCTTWKLPPKVFSSFEEW